MDAHKKIMEGFHRLTPLERARRVQDFCGLTEDEFLTLTGQKTPPIELAENFIENVVGYFPLPLGIATYFHIDGRARLIPMAVEETSIIAAASSTAKWVQSSGSIHTYTKGNLIIGQIQIPRVKNLDHTREVLHQNRDELIALANQTIPGLVARGGGVRDLTIRVLDRADHSDQQMLVIHVLCDPCDAMGANLINQICENLKPKIEEITEQKVGLCILSNLVDTKLVVAELTIRNIDPKVGRGIEEAYLFAASDPYRAATHNKGILNGIDPILIATGNDWRAVESGIHAYAARSGKYQPVTTWKMEGPDLVGRFEAPICVGVVGGVTRLHPTAKIALKILGVTRAEELSRICAAVGLVQNLGALKALSTVGIVQGHMKLHTANLALAAGAEIHEIDEVRKRLSDVLNKERKIHLSDAQNILNDIRKKTNDGQLNHSAW
jgi:hydroxymethylglutaryl-CoA reductase